MSSEFSDRPFVAGSLIGTRSFRIDQLGRLTGVVHRTVWRPEVNFAIHQANLFSGGMFSTSYMNQLFFGAYVGDPTRAKPVEVEAKVEHKAGTLNCNCGFYAYFDNADNPYHGPTQGVIRGLIEGFGVVTVGSRGFRSEKAVLKALVIPPKKLELQLFRAVSVNYAGVPIFERHRDALAAFPLTPPPLPSPDTEPDFWTRAS